MRNQDLKRRILQISYENKLSHIGSCLTAVDIIDEIYKTKKPDEKFVLSSGHAGLALYCVIEKYENIAADGIFNEHGIHPDRCDKCHISCSSGSLGHGLPIAVGMALADRTKDIYCLISDGECSEGSIYEALNICEDKKINNLKIYINYNSWGAYRAIGEEKMQFLPHFYAVCPTNMSEWPSWLQGQLAHYAIMSYDQYQEALRCLQ